MNHLAQFFKDARSIWIGFLSILAAAAWAGDQRWMPKEDSDKLISVIEIRSLSQRNDELEIQKTYEPDAQRKQMFEAMININKNKIETIINEKKITGE